MNAVNVLGHLQMRSHALALALVACTVVPAFGQQCPTPPDANSASTPSEERTLEGKLVFHNGLRHWFELRLDQPQCGQASIQLVPTGLKWMPLEVRRGCRVRTRGTIDYSGTGYFSVEIYQDVKEIESVGACAPQSPFPDYSKAMPDKAISRYRVDMRVNYERGDHPIVFRVSSGGKELRPWQAYAHYYLTGLFILYGYCGTGFVVDRVYGTAEANPSHFDESPAGFDPESAAAAGKTHLDLGYTCVREP